MESGRIAWAICFNSRHEYIYICIIFTSHRCKNLRVYTSHIIVSEVLKSSTAFLPIILNSEKQSASLLEHGQIFFLFETKRAR